MAKGDVVAGGASVGNSTFYNYQPAAGVETCITGLSLGVNASNSARISNGTVDPIYVKGDAVEMVTAKMFINNTWYLRLYNGSGAGSEMGYTGVQVK